MDEVLKLESQLNFETLVMRLGKEAGLNLWLYLN